ncbi:MAG: hypothetical protein M0Q44_20655 [Methylobacter sp.]|jgi:hypothetical protein|nr:hypothetical protein [Methylobacter sp.]
MDSLKYYRQLRTEGMEFNSKLFGQLTRTDLDNIGRLLGILRKGILRFDEEGTGGTDINHFSNFAIFDYCNAKGLNVIQRYWQQYQGQLSREEDRLIQAYLNTRSSLFSVIEIDLQKSTIKLQDLFDDNYQVEITDISMSQFPLLNDCLIFTRVLTLESFNITSGVSFVFRKDKEEILRKKYKSMIKQTVAYTPQAKNFIVFLKLSHKFGVPLKYA